MILHLASFHWRPEVTESDVAELTDALRAMAADIPALRSYQAGPNLHLRPGGADYGVAAIVDDAAALDVYLDSDAHLAVYDRLLGRMIAERAAVQLPIDEGSLR